MYTDALHTGISGTALGDEVAEAALLRAALDTQREMICAWKPDGTVLYCNAEYRGFFGYDATVCGANLRELVEWSPGESVSTQVERIRAAGGELVTVRRYADGRSVEWTDSVLPGADGAPASIVSVGRDVTVALRVEGALRTTQNRLRAILRHTSDAVVLLDRHLAVIESSPHHRSFLGYPPGTWRGTDPLQVVHPQDRDAAVAVLRSLLRRSEGGARAEVRLRRADGDLTFVELTGANLLDDADVCAIVLTVRSVEDRRAMERAAEERQRSLEEQLRQRIGFVEEASHALRNPLHGMLGLSELLTKAELDTSLADAAWAIFRQASTMRRIVDDMLDHALIEVGHLRVDMTDVDLQYAVNDCVRLARARAADGVQVRDVEVPADLRIVRGDPDRVRQVLSNLLTNALAATSVGEVSISVTRGAEAGMVRCTVEDDGPGVAPDDVERLFRPYERGNAADPSGVGLGLTIARGAAEAMGGTMGAAARVAGGAGVWFELHGVGAPPQQTIVGAEQASSVPPGRRVLVVDDDPVNLMLAGMQVERLGGIVTTVSSGFAALAAMEEGEFDVAFIDVQMPEMDGLELVRRVATASGPTPLLAVMTASATAADRAAARAAGADLFLPKPVTLDDMRAALDVRREARAFSA